MAKKKLDLSKLMKEVEFLLDLTKEVKTEVRREIRKNRGCDNHPDVIIYKGTLCVECDSELRNLRNKKNADREPWISTDGYKRIYAEDGSVKLYHRYVVEDYLNRPLRKEEKVAFIDKDKSNCLIENLAILVLVPVVSMQYQALPM